MLGHGDFTVTPRRGELIVFDKLARALVNHVLLPVPSAKTKGVLVAPTVYGNVLLGPTADDVESKEDRSTTAAGPRLPARATADGSCPRLVEHEVTATYVGLRAATEDRDYQLASIPSSDTSAPAESARPACPRRWRSPSTCARALPTPGCSLSSEPREVELRMPNIGELAPRPYQQPELIARDPDFGRIVCFCERVTRGELERGDGEPDPAL